MSILGAMNSAVNASTAAFEQEKLQSLMRGPEVGLDEALFKKMGDIIKSSGYNKS